MNLLSVKPPTIPIPLHKYLKVVAIVDASEAVRRSAAHRRRIATPFLDSKEHGFASALI
jgi:hypothetical protein